MITVENYFKISELLEKSKTIDFELFRGDVFKKGGVFSSDNLETIFSFYEYAKKEQQPQGFVFKILAYKKLVYLLAFTVGVVCGFLLLGKELDVNKFLFWSLFLPFTFMVWGFFQLVFYNYPTKQEHSLFDSLLKKYMGEKYNTQRYNHIIKLLTTQTYYTAVIFYALGSLVVAFYTSFFNAVHFSYSSTFSFVYQYEERVLHFIAAPWAYIVPWAVPHKGCDDGTWAAFLFFALVVWVVLPRLVLMLLSKKVLQKAMQNSLEHQAHELLRVVATSAKTNVQEHPFGEFLQEADEHYEQTGTKHAEQNTQSIFYIFYEMERLEYERLSFKLPHYLREKKVEKYSLGLWEQEDELEVITALENLVLVFCSPQSLPDETFKEMLKTIRKNKVVQQIWVVPLIEEDGMYKKATPYDRGYEDYKIHIQRLEDDKIRLFDDR